MIPPPLNTLAGKGGIMEEMKKTLEDFEKKMTLLYQDEMNLENRYGEVETTFANNVGFHATMLGGGSIFGTMFVSNRINVFFIFATVLVHFIVKAGLAGYAARRKLRKMDWEVNEITRRRARLKGPIKKFEKQLMDMFPGLLSEYDTSFLEDAKSVVNNMVHSLENESGWLKKHQMKFLKANLVVASFYVLGVVAFALAFNMTGNVLIILFSALQYIVFILLPWVEREAQVQCLVELQHRDMKSQYVHNILDC